MLFVFKIIDFSRFCNESKANGFFMVLVARMLKRQLIRVL